MRTLATLGLMLILTGCTKFQLLDATVPAWGYARTGDIGYGELPRQTLDVYQPDHATSPAPIVVFFYGGDWQEGNKEGYRFVAQALTSRGFIVVVPDYRVYPDVTFPAFVEDGARAVRWAYDHALAIGGDPNHIYLMGHSAGAHIAAMLTLNERYLRAVGLDRTAIRATASLSGPYDFVPPAGDLAVFGMTPATAGTDPPREPIPCVDGRAAPMLLIHGLKDEIVQPGNATRLADRIRERGGEAPVITYPDRAHVGVVLSLAWPFRWLAPTLDDVTKFVREQEDRRE
jgi:acetyl esterase/lipase